MKRGGWRTAVLVAAIVVLLIVLRLLFGSWQELRAARQVEGSDATSAALHYGRAIRWYVPGNPWVAKAVAQLKALAQAQQHSGAVRDGLNSWQVLQASLAATRSFYQPYAADLQLARQSIATLMADTEKDRGVSAAQVLATFDYPADPDLLWALVASGGFIAWIVATVFFIYNGFNAAGVFIGGRRAYLSGAGALAAMVVWVIGLALA